ncbi:MAG: DUF1127 domain-containing protein [Pseudomonadota bacterium]
MSMTKNLSSNVIVGEFRTSLLSRLFSRFVAWRRRQVAIAQLQQMPDRLLADIGIERYQISDFVNKSDAADEVTFRAPAPYNKEVALPHAA